MILRYVKGIFDYGLLFSKHGTNTFDEVLGYRDLDYCEDKSDKKLWQGMCL